MVANKRLHGHRLMSNHVHVCGVVTYWRRTNKRYYMFEYNVEQCLYTTLHIVVRRIVLGSRPKMVFYADDDDWLGIGVLILFLSA